MPKGPRIGSPPKNTIERLQELRHQADLAGDTDTRDRLAAMIVKQGGTVPTSEIPEDETKVGRLERLRQEALDANDTETADKLSEMIADEPQLTECEPDLAPVESASCIDHANAESAAGRVWINPDAQNASEPDTPHEGRNLTDEEEAHAVVEERPRFAGDEEADQSEDKADDTEPVNNGTASVNAANLIKRKGYLLAEIVARSGGKVDLIDVKAYTKMLTKA